MLAVRRAQITQTVHVREAVCEDTREGGGHGTQQVEDRIALLQLEARIPARQQIGAARKESSLKDTKDESQTDHLRPVRQKTKADHCGAPEERDRGQEDARADFAEDDGRWRLQKDVGREEDQSDDGVAVADQDEIWWDG